MERPEPAGPEEQRRRLVRACAAVVAERGYRATRIGDVTALAGLPTRAFRTWFADLDDCFLAAYEQGANAVLARMNAAYEAEQGWRDAARAALRELLEALAAEPALARACVLEAGAAGPRVCRASRRVLARMRSFMAGPGTPEAPEIIRRAVVGGIHGVIYRQIEAGRTHELPALHLQLSRFMLRYFPEGDAEPERVAS